MAGTKTDTVFSFANGKTIALCGYKNTRFQPVTYSEFVLAECGKDSIIGSWGATSNCRFEMKEDTLRVKTMVYLPTGKQFAFQLTPWRVDNIYFKNNQTVRKYGISKELPTYSPAEIHQVLQAYETLNPAPEKGEENIDIAAKLLMATISGSHKARGYFEEFPNKVNGLGAHLSEIYDRYQDMLNLWRNTKNK